MEVPVNDAFEDSWSSPKCQVRWSNITVLFLWRPIVCGCSFQIVFSKLNPALTPFCFWTYVLAFSTLYPLPHPPPPGHHPPGPCSKTPSGCLKLWITDPIYAVLSCTNGRVVYTALNTLDKEMVHVLGRAGWHKIPPCYSEWHVI